MKIGIIREGKAPPDARVPFTPEQCRMINTQMQGLKIVVQSSDIRCFQDSEYVQHGVEVTDDLSDCDVLMGVKEVPVDQLIPGKMYFIFSHTIKKQPYNRKLLRAIAEKGIQLVDYEVLTDKRGNRIIGFGRFAGLVGAYNGFRAYGIRNRTFSLKPAYRCHDMQEMKEEIRKVSLPAIRIVLTGGGRVAGGALELFEHLGIRSVSVDEFLSLSKVKEPQYVQLLPGDYNRHREGLTFDLLHFYNYPKEYAGTFHRFLSATDMLVAAAYWDPVAPVLFTQEDTRNPEFRISIIADITCDINGSVPTTHRASTINDPFYDFDPITGELREPFSSEKHITVMAVDNLPCELPRDASLDFGNNLMEKVLPCLAGVDPDDIIGRASITRRREPPLTGSALLTDRFAYLQDYLDGRE